MLKMEINEINTLLSIIEVGTFQGKDIPIMNAIIEKLQNEAIKLNKAAKKDN
tara:strand:+ start:3117 stop:3272 length:156 start_codon:yes stop_codon:yes gene_type:complete